MSAVGALNWAAAALALAASLLLGLRTGVGPSGQSAPRPALEPGATVELRAGRPGLVDASGRFVPLAAYRRIVAASTLANELLLALCEPDRIAAFAHNGSGEQPWSFRYAGKPALPGAAAPEALIALQPDLVLLNAPLAGAQRVERLREAGLQTFDLGAMRGLHTLLPSIRAMGILLGRPEQGAQLARRFERRMRTLASAGQSAQRPSGIYLSLYGDALSGGTDGTSYHDVLEAAGVRDVAAQRYADWPRYTPEALLALDPELIVTHVGMGAAICAQPGLQALRACERGRVVELDAALLGDPGLGMLDAAEALFERVHPLP